MYADRMPDNQEKEMLNQSFRNRSIKSVSALLSASALAMAMGLSQPAQASEPFLGEIETFGFGFAPRDWAFCDGQLLQISQNSALFSLLGTTFGGDGRTTFGLPDLRGRVAVHVGNGPGLSAVTAFATVLVVSLFTKKTRIGFFQILSNHLL